MDNDVVPQKGIVETPVKTLFKKFAAERDVTLVYGDPIEVGLVKVVPVAKVKYAFGGGGDGAGGEGGGGRFTITPVGAYEITPEAATFKPVRNGRLPFILILLTFGLVLLTRKTVNRKKR